MVLLIYKGIFFKNCEAVGESDRLADEVGLSGCTLVSTVAVGNDEVALSILVFLHRKFVVKALITWRVGHCPLLVLHNRLLCAATRFVTTT